MGINAENMGIQSEVLNKTTKSNLQQSKSIHKTKNNAETFESHTLGIGLNRFSSVKNCFKNTMKFFISLPTLLALSQLHTVASKSVSLNARSDVPGFHYLLRNSPNMMEYIFENQLWKGSVVSNGVFHTYQHPGGKVERGFEDVLQEAVKHYDSRTFPQDVNAYWTFQIRLARRNSHSKWHSYAKTLLVGIQTIKIRKPKNWMGTMVTKWNDVKEVKVIINFLVLSISKYFPKS